MAQLTNSSLSDFEILTLKFERALDAWMPGRQKWRMHGDPQPRLRDSKSSEGTMRSKLTSPSCSHLASSSS